MNAPLVLVVEDEAQIRRFVRAALEGDGCRVAEAQTMAQGLVDAGTRKPDLVILDLGLPDGDGVDFVRDLRTWSHLPVLILSARSTESDKIRVLDAGADDYLTKPFGVGELLARMRVALRKAAPAVKSSTAVSPNDRPTESMMPVLMPGSALGSTMRVMVCHLLKPRE